MLMSLYGCANETHREQAGEWGIELTQVRGKFICPDLQNTGQCAERFAKKFDTAHPGLVRRDTSDRPQIKLRNEQYFSFSAIGEETDSFAVLELQANDRFAIIRQQFFEGNSWQILDLENGQLTEIYGYPLFSPDKTKFAAASEDLMAGFSETVLDIYQVSADGVLRTFRAIRPKDDWAARNIRWEGKDVIRFSQTRYNGNSSTGYDKNPAYLSFQNGNWSLHGDKAQ
jgi:hypothetical protein